MATINLSSFFITSGRELLTISVPGLAGVSAGLYHNIIPTHASHTDPEQGAQGPKLTNDDEQFSVYDLPQLDDWRKN